MEESDCLRAVGSLEHCKAGVAQHLPYSEAKRRLIFHNQYRGVRRYDTTFPPYRDGVGNPASRSSLRRKQNLKSRAFAHFTLNADCATQTPDNSVDHRKSETAAGRLVLKNGSKILAWTSRDMPLPVSETFS